MAGRQFVPFIEGRIEDAHVRPIDESQRTVVFCKGQIVRQGRRQGRVVYLDFPRRRGKSRLVIGRHGQRRRQALTEALLIHRQGPFRRRRSQGFDEVPFRAIVEIIVYTHSMGQVTGDAPVGAALADRRDGCIAALDRVVAIGIIGVVVFQRRRRRQDDVGITGRIGHKAFVDDGK